MDKATIEIQVVTIVDSVATDAARHAFLDAVKRAKTAFTVAEWPEMLAFVREEALDCAREVALQIAKDFNVRGTFDDDALSFTSVGGGLS